ncbi:ROK family transcriptional regulator [Solicola sp. PLA-1-18]|uniref:ROK family transcriptional regulator n=1 Tax=Solicola sp. PLA-1-18 TaxID=3380532 RepID=UPI003B80D5AD
MTTDLSTGPGPSGPAAPGAGVLFQLLRDGHARTRAELADLTSLARSTVAARVDALIRSGLVAPIGEAVSTGGRPPARFAINASSRVVVAVDAGASHVSLAVTDLSGEVLLDHTEPLSIDAGPDAVLATIAELGTSLVRRADRTVADVAGVGIGLPGPVAHETGRPSNPPIMPGWHDHDVPATLRRTFDAPVLVDNDVNLMALGEHTSHWSRVDHLLFVKVATGIGAGLIANRQLDRGAQGTAGDLGHVQVPGLADDVPCRCGNVGCLEAVAAGPAVAARLREQGLDVDDSTAVVAAVQAGEMSAVHAVRQAGRDLGAVLATCVSLLNPSVIVVGGELAEAGEHLLAGVREVVYQRSLPIATTNLRIVPARTGRGAGALGAAAMVLDHVLSPASVESYVAENRPA